MLKLENIRKQFGKLTVLEGVSFELSEPGIYAILGPNGSGKTTLLKSILGMVIPEDGRIRVNSEDAIGNWQYRQDISYLPQIASFPENLNVSELIYMVMDIRNCNDSKRKDELVKRFGLESFMSKKLGELSGGTKQKVNIVLAFMHESGICILDEPTAGLDPVSLIELKKLIREEKQKNKIILITTHIMSLVEELADEIIFLLEGHIRFQGSPESLRKNTGKDDIEHAIASLLKK